MGDENNYIIENIYQGGYSSLAPDYGSLFTGYRADAGSLGLSTDPRTANVLKEMSEKIAPGQKIIELSLIQPEIFDSIPKQHLKEINRLSKLTGVDVTVHGPLVEASGISQQGFSESSRELAERQMLHAVERSHEVNPDGNVPVTFHTSAGISGPDLKRTKEGVEIMRESVINQETGQISLVKKEERFRPFIKDIRLLREMYPEIKEEELRKHYAGTKEGEIIKEIHSTKDQIEIINHTNWSNSLQQLITPKEHADRIIIETAPLIKPIIEKINSGEIHPEELGGTQRQIFSRFENAHEQLIDIRAQLATLFDKAYKYGSDNDKKKLKGIAKNFGQALSFNGGNDIRAQSKAIQSLMEDLRPLNPRIYKPVEEFAMDKSATSFGNVAFEAYKKFGDKAPIVNIENPPAGFGFSRGKDLRNMIEKSREKFVERATQEGMNKEGAEREAEKLIGATWDVGHINQLRKFGFSGKDIVEEAGEVAHLVKHIHLSDNFGMENIELPMGMGNVDLKEVMEKLGEKGEKARKIVEAAAWWQHQQTNPMGATFEALGSPIYSMNMAPYWNQAVGLHQGYFGGLEGNWLPQINYETFGAGFSNLPVELGGQRGGAGGRMSGRPME